MTILDVAKRTMARQSLVLKKNSPHILFVAGVAGVLSGTYLACKATLKLEKTLDDCRNDLVDAKNKDEIEGTGKAVAVAYTKNALKVTKIYAPSAAVMGLSLAALTTSHITLSKRNAALMSAYALLQTAYQNYRDKVRQEIGEEREAEIYKSVMEDIVNAHDDGVIIDPNILSPYAKFFDEGSPCFVKDPELNRLFIQGQQNYANHKLHAHGYVFLNEVYEMLGIERSSAGQVVGWIIKPDKPNYIDFGIFSSRNSPFVNGFERAILLDFNVDGVIYDKIGKRTRRIT